MNGKTHESDVGRVDGAARDLVRLRSAVEATRLNFGLTRAEVRELVDRARQLGARGVCVPAQYVPIAAGRVREVGVDAGLAGDDAARGPSDFDIVTVANFPTGDHPVEDAERVAAAAVRAGANHVDLVVPGGLVAERHWRGVVDYVRRVREAMQSEAPGPVALKVILETAAWDRERLHGAALAALEAGADWLKTSTGFHPAGGATVEAVEYLRSIAPAGVGIKASGGIRTRAAALAMLDAGADRIGTSSEREVLRP